MNGPNNAERRPGRGGGAQHDYDQTTVQQNIPQASIAASSIDRCQHIVNLGAVLAMDLAALAARTGRGDYAAAALHMVDATRAAWLASEMLTEGVM